jgi:uncharacterized phage-associated protein
MTFRFEIDKSIASTGLVIQEAGGRYTLLHIVKTLYYANRRFLVEYGRTITGDRFVSMDMGPVVSQTYDLLKGSAAADPSNLIKWRTFISPPEGYKVRILRKPDLQYLSKQEIQFLQDAYLVVSQVKMKISDWSHSAFPEWKDPHGGSEDIDPADILRIENKSPDEISAIEEEVSCVSWLKSIAK